MNQMQQMLMQAQKMQRELKKAHDELNSKEFTVSKGGLVVLTMLGDRSVKSLSIKPDALIPDNEEMLEETIKLAFAEAMANIQKENESIDERITGQKGGMPF